MPLASQTGSFVPTNFIWDIQQIQQTNLDPQAKELLVRLYQNINLIALSLNIKDTGMYQLSEFVNGQLFFPNPANNSSTLAVAESRQVYRKVINFGALPNAGTKAVAHGITCNSSTTFTRIYGAASDTTGFNYIPLPYASPTLINNIELKVDSTNVTIITGSNRSAFNISYIVLEWIQS